MRDPYTAAVAAAAAAVATAARFSKRTKIKKHFEPRVSSLIQLHPRGKTEAIGTALSHA
jgi:hypothetical protein